MDLKIAATVTFCVLYFLEVVLTLLVNIFTIFVFWKHRAESKRTLYLLVNLAFADLLMAISILFTLFRQVENVQERISLGFVSWDVFCEASSLLNLLVISLERLFAVHSPFRHRTFTRTSYIYILGVVWATAGILFMFIQFLPMNIGDIFLFITSPFFVVVLTVICVAYTLICLETRRNLPDESRNERRVQQN